MRHGDVLDRGNDRIVTEYDLDDMLLSAKLYRDKRLVATTTEMGVLKRWLGESPDG